MSKAGRKAATSLRPQTPYKGSRFGPPRGVFSLLEAALVWSKESSHPTSPCPGQSRQLASHQTSSSLSLPGPRGESAGLAGTPVVRLARRVRWEGRFPGTGTRGRRCLHRLRLPGARAPGWKGSGRAWRVQGPHTSCVGTQSRPESVSNAVGQPQPSAPGGHCPYLLSRRGGGGGGKPITCTRGRDLTWPPASRPRPFFLKETLHTLQKGTCQVFVVKKFKRGRPDHPPVRGHSFNQRCWATGRPRAAG